MPIDGNWRNPAVSRCARKRAVHLIAEAEKLAEKQSLKTGHLIIAYLCYDCGLFHIGHADESQQIVRRPPDPPSLPTTCPRCKKPIPEARRQAAEASGAQTVYCSVKCRDKLSRKRRRTRKYGSRPKIK